MAERIHGGVDFEAARARGSDPTRIVDFSVNLNPYGPCEPVLRAVREAELARYPDPHARRARAAWAHALACTPDQLAVGHGAADLIWAIARAALQPGARVAMFMPTFSELLYAARACGAEVLPVIGREPYRTDLEGLAHLEPQLIYLCSPNNPTGEYVAWSRIEALARQLPHTLILVDHSFLGFSDHVDDARAALPENVIRVRSLTKEFAVPGLRIGLCQADPAWIARIEAQRPTWATSSPALAALEACAGEHTFVRDSFVRLHADREAVRRLLQERGLTPLPSDTSYQLVPVHDAAAISAAWLRHGVQVRDCSSFGLPRHVRVAALPLAARERLAAALDATSRAG